MAGFNVNAFRTRGLSQSGARPSLFSVELTFPTIINIPGATDKAQFLIRTASLPSSILDSIDVPYFGRRIKVFGNRNIEDWEVTIINDNDFLLRNAFEAWHNAINTIVSNRLDPAVSGVDPSVGTSYKTTAVVTQYRPEGPGISDSEGAIKSYLFDGIFPTAISDIPLDWDAQNQIEQFSVRFSVDWYEPKTNSGSEPIFPIELVDDGN